MGKRPVPHREAETNQYRADQASQTKQLARGQNSGEGAVKSTLLSLVLWARTGTGPRLLTLL